MSNENVEEKGLMEKLRHTYRLVVMNNETFEEVGSYRLSLLNVYILISTIIVFVALFVIAIIVFTPAKRYIPGYGDASQHAELLRLNKKIQEIESELTANRAYTDNFRRILVGDVVVNEEQLNENTAAQDSQLNVERIKEDELLRKEVELDEQIQERELMSRTSNFSPSQLPIEQMYFVPPVKGLIGAAFQPDKKHFGIDISAPKNTAVKAIMDGFVITSDWTLETGHTIGIQHSNSLISFYKHNSELLKKTGSIVKAGEAVAIIGNSGTLSSGPHLHFEIWYKGKPINPIDYIIFE